MAKPETIIENKEPVEEKSLREKAIEIKNIQDRMEKRREKRHRNKIISVAVLCSIAVLGLYFGGVKFYDNHFCPGTIIKGIHCSNMTLDAAEEKIAQRISDYKYYVKTKSGTEEIIGEDIELSCNSSEAAADVMRRQNPWIWFLSAAIQDNNISLEVSYNEELLYNKFKALSCVQETEAEIRSSIDNIVFNEETHTFIYTYDDVEYASAPQEALNKAKPQIVDRDKTYTYIKNDINSLKKNLNLEYKGCYINIEADVCMSDLLERMNKLVSAKIFYKNDAGEDVAYIDAGSINQWLTVDEEFNIAISKEMITEYVDALAVKYNTVGKERNFKNSLGQDITISGGDYGWIMNEETEEQIIEDTINNGETIERKPEFKQTAQVMDTSDIGGTYAEISINEQKIWFYKDGNLVVTSSIVTGNPYLGNQTNIGVYKLKSREKNAVLVGADYRTPVSYWMPFNRGQGMHDATWRGRFGGQIYKGNGSHGCVNLPLSVAAEIYKNITVGDPVIVY